jgi:CHAT domain-containing protein/tetratricopeptide (TPR) repeat protein
MYYIKSIGCLFFLFYSWTLWGQMTAIDSQKVNALFATAREWRTKDANKALLLWDSAALYCQKKQYWARYVDACSNAAFQSTALDQPNICYDHVKQFEGAFNKYATYLGQQKDSIQQNVLLANSYYYFIIGDHKNVLNNLNFHLNILLRKSLTKQNVYFVSNDYFNIGANELALGNIQKAIDNYTEVYKIVQQYYPRDFRRIIQLNINLCELYRNILNYSQASIHYKKALVAKDSIEIIIKKSKKSEYENINQTYLLLYKSLSEFYIKRKLYDSAIYALNTSLTFQTQEHPQWYSIMKRLGDAHIEANKLDKAREYLQQSLFAAQKKYIRHYNLAQIYLSFSRLYDKKADYARALGYTQQALIALSEKFNNTGITTTPPQSEVFSKRDLLEVLDFKTGLLLKSSPQKPHYLDIAFRTAQEAENLIDIIRSDCTSDFDKQYLSELCYPVYEKSVRIAAQLYARDKSDVYLTAVYQAIEKNKASVLLEALKNAQAEGGLSEADRNRLYQLRSEIAKLEEKIYREKNQNKKTIDDPSVIALQERLKAVKIDFDIFIQRLEKQYPDYYRLKFGKLTRDMVEIQQSLTPNDLLLNYFVTENTLFIFAMSQNKVQLFTKAIDTTFEKNLLNLRRFITEKYAYDAQTFSALAYPLYDKLLKDPLIAFNFFTTGRDNLFKSKRLIIVPDGLLHYIPFDVLVQENDTAITEFAKLPYVIRQYSVNYAYSAAALWEQKHFKRGRAKKLFAGFAPQYSADTLTIARPLATTRSNPLRNLPGAKREVEYAATVFKGDTYMNQEATEQQFRTVGQNYRVLHMGMHSLLNDKFPLISNLVFTKKDSSTDNELTINELYGLHLNADLAVLSACNTGMGDIHRGEGVISLSRAFTYAGVPATIMSLWEVEDMATSKVIDSLYTNLNALQEKDQALRNAKIAYLDGAKTNAEAHPFFWAGLIAIGNTEPLDVSTPLSMYWFFGALPLLFFAFLYVKRKKNNINRIDNNENQKS